MKTAGKIALHTWFVLSIAVCILGGDTVSAMLCAMWYGSVIEAIHG